MFFQAINISVIRTQKQNLEEEWTTRIQNGILNGMFPLYDSALIFCVVEIFNLSVSDFV
jgi:hypothetical protein